MLTGVSLFVWLPEERARCRMVVHKRCRLRSTIQRAPRGNAERAQLRAQWDAGPRRCHESGKSAPLLIIRSGKRLRCSAVGIMILISGLLLSQGRSYILLSSQEISVLIKYVGDEPQSSHGDHDNED